MFKSDLQNIWEFIIRNKINYQNSFEFKAKQYIENRLKNYVMPNKYWQNRLTKSTTNETKYKLICKINSYFSEILEQELINLYENFKKNT